MKGDTTEEDVGNDKDGFFITRSFDYLSGLIKPKVTGFPNKLLFCFDNRLSSPPCVKPLWQLRVD